MPALVRTDHVGTVAWLGRVPAREGPGIVITCQPLDEMPLTFAGCAQDVHAGLTRPSCSRTTTQYPKGTEIRNVRQLSIVSSEELAMIAQTLDLAAIDPGWLGASVVVTGLPDLSHLPPSSRLQAEGGCTLTIDMQNLPCRLPAKEIERAHPGHGKAFKTAAAGLRGVTAWVEREGTLRIGQTVRLHVPAQRRWQGA